MFHPIGGGARSSTGETDESGRFTMSTFEVNDGALLGKHQVTISKADTSGFEAVNAADTVASGGYGSSDMYKQMMASGGKNLPKGKQLLPEKYSQKETSLIEVEVTADGPNEFPFELE
jgi:hypothetical protein